MLCALLFCSLFLGLSCAQAQVGAVDAAIGFGTMQNGANGTGLDYTDLSSCVPDTGYCSSGSKHLGGMAMGFSGQVMLTKKYGVGGEVMFQPAQQDYVNFYNLGVNEAIKSRMTMYDVNGIVRPLRSKNAALQFEGGFGGASVRFYDTYSSSSSLGNSNNAAFLSSANHFQLHAGVAVPIWTKKGFFVRPQFDIHYVPNLSDQYKNDLVTQATLWVGYSFGHQ